jgi:AI-2 transport protein TqsA
MDGVALMHSAAQAQVSKYIQGKVIIALVVAGVHAAVLFYVGLELFLVFGLLSFALNFVPAIGMYISILLPMPLVVLDDAFTPMEALLAFVLPLLIGLAAKDVMEPLLIGSATRLQPVAMLLATLLWGGIWGITGMVRGPRCAQNCAA